MGQQTSTPQLDEIKAAAEAGNPKAQVKLGHIYYDDFNATRVTNNAS